MNTFIQFPEKNYIVFDFETTGVDPDKSEVIEISAIKFIDGARKPTFSCLVLPNLMPSAEIVRLTGINHALLEKEGKPAEPVWKEFALYIEDLPLIAHNGINFDRLFLENAFRKYNLTAPSIYRYVDTAMMVKAQKLREKQRWYESHFHFCKRVSEIRAFGIYFKLTLCCEEMGIDVSQFQAHRAGGDIEMTNEVYKRLVFGNKNQPSIEDLKQKQLELSKDSHI